MARLSARPIVLAAKPPNAGFTSAKCSPPLEAVPCSKCSHPVILPFQMRQFELREIIASGGMGTVFRSFDVTLERNVAVKLLKREMAEDPQVLKSFYREARAGAALNHT